MTRAARESLWTVGAAAIVATMVVVSVVNEPHMRSPQPDEVVAVFAVVLAALTVVRAITWGVRRRGDPPAAVTFWREAVIVIGVGLLVWAWSTDRYENDVKAEMVAGAALTTVGILASRRRP